MIIKNIEVSRKKNFLHFSMILSLKTLLKGSFFLRPKVAMVNGNLIEDPEFLRIKLENLSPGEHLLKTKMPIAQINTFIVSFGIVEEGVRWYEDTLREVKWNIV